MTKTYTDSTNSTFLITPKSYLKGFILASDREFYSRPVRVTPLYTELSTRFVFVHEPIHNRTFPVRHSNLTQWHHLSARQQHLMVAA